MSDLKFERRDVNQRAIWRIAAGLGAGLLVVLVVAAFLMKYWSVHPSSPVRATFLALPSIQDPQPALQVEPTKELRTYLQEQEEILGQYAWTDREAGRVRIPIRQAMQRLLERGLASGPDNLTPRDLQRQKASETP